MVSVPFSFKKWFHRSSLLQKMVSVQFSCHAGNDFSTVFLLLQGSKMRFLDTMSMHIAVCGLTSFQRILYQSSAKDTSRKEVREHSERQKMFNMASVCIFILSVLYDGEHLNCVCFVFEENGIFGTQVELYILFCLELPHNVRYVFLALR